MGKVSARAHGDWKKEKDSHPACPNRERETGSGVDLEKTVPQALSLEDHVLRQLCLRGVLDSPYFVRMKVSDISGIYASKIKGLVEHHTTSEQAAS